MPLRINTNIPGLNARRIMNITGRDLQHRIERLSSGLRVNRAADDAAGLSVSEGLRAEISGFRQGIRNSEHAINLVQTAEGALNEVNSMLLRLRQLAVQSASSTVNDSNRASLNSEFVQIISEVDRVARVTSYNNDSLLTGFGNTVSQSTAVSSALASGTTGVVAVAITGAAAGTYAFSDAGDGSVTLGNGVVTQTVSIRSAMDFDTSSVVASGSSIVASFDRLGLQLTLSGQRDATAFAPATDGYRTGDLDSTQLVIESGTGGQFQVGPDEGAVHRLNVNIGDMRASGQLLNLGSASVSSLAASQQAISSIDQAITQVTRVRGDLGAIQNRLSFNVKANSVMEENDIASESSIRDANVAEEVSAFTRAQILTQSGLAMFAQANLSATSALTLLG